MWCSPKSQWTHTMSKLSTRPVPTRTPRKNGCDVARRLQKRNPMRTATATTRTAIRSGAELTGNTLAVARSMSRRAQRPDEGNDDRQDNQNSDQGHAEACHRHRRALSHHCAATWIACDTWYALVI